MTHNVHTLPAHDRMTVEQTLEHVRAKEPEGVLVIVPIYDEDGDIETFELFTSKRVRISEIHHLCGFAQNFCTGQIEE